VGYKGKSSAAMAAAMLAVYGGYFLWASRPGLRPADVLAAMVATIVALAVLATVLEIVIQITERRARAAGRMSDERDIRNAARGARNGYYALLAVIWVAPVIVLLGSPALFTANCLLGMIVFAEVVHFGSRALYDARGV
jgi:hypothetical protein